MKKQIKTNSARGHSIVACLSMMVLMFVGCDNVTSPQQTESITPLMSNPGSGVLNSELDASYYTVDGFYFLPPMVSSAEYSGTFDPDLSPVVEICETPACNALHASFDMDGDGSEQVRMEEADEHYIVNWNTNSSGAAVGQTYRVRVMVAGTMLGHADVAVVSTGREAIQVRSDGLIALVANQTLPVKFRVEKGAVYVTDSGGGTINSEDGLVTFEIPANAIDGTIAITISSAIDNLNDEDVVPGALFDFGPSPYTFNEPVMLTITYDPTKLPAGVSEDELRLLAVVDGEWVQLPGSSVDVMNSTVTGPLESFSRKGVGRGKINQIAVTPVDASVGLGETVQFEALVTDVDGEEMTRNVQWSSSDEEVATVDGTGLATGNIEGEAEITASSGPSSGSALLSVEADLPAGPWSLGWFRQADVSFFMPAMGVDLDGTGNSYVIGRYSGEGTLGGVQLPFGTQQRVLLAKYDINGNPQWVTSFGGTASTEGTGISVSQEGSFCISAYFDGTVTVGPGYSFTSGGSRDLLVAKYDSDGGLLWAKAAGGSSANFTQGVVIDAEGNCIITGSISGSVSFGSGFNFSTGGGGTENMFVAHYGSNGTLNWVQVGQGASGGRDVDVDAAGNVYVTGHAQNGTIFSGTSLNIPNAGNREAFIVKYSSDGVIQWLTGGGGLSQVEGFAIAVDDDGNSHITGWYRGEATFGSTVLPSVTAGRVFVSKLNSQGDFLWTLGGESSGFDSNSSQSISLDPAGNLYFTGWFRDNLTLGGMLLTEGGQNSYVTKFGPGGDFISATVGPGGHVTTDGLGNVWVANTFSGTIEIAGESYVAASSNSLYLAKLIPGSP